MVVATEELAWGSLGVGGSLITRPEILTRALVRGGTEEQKQRWLPRIAQRRAHGRCHRHRARLRLRRRAPRGHRHVPVDGGYRVNGVKTWATFAGRADVLMLLARTDPDRADGSSGPVALRRRQAAVPGHTFYVTGPDGAGRMQGRAIDTIGYRGMHSYEVAFDDWFVAGREPRRRPRRA